MVYYGFKTHFCKAVKLHGNFRRFLYIFNNARIKSPKSDLQGIKKQTRPDQSFYNFRDILTRIKKKENPERIFFLINKISYSFILI